VGLTRGVVFDLDDTLYLERAYVGSGFRAIAAIVEQRCGLPRSLVWRTLQRMFQQGVRHDTFDRLLAEHPLLATRFTVPELVIAYRDHRPDITLLPGVYELLRALRRHGTGLALITDGPVISQRSKIEQLGISPFVPTQVLTGVWPADFAKPHSRAFEEVAGRLQIPTDELVYVADNPAKDFAAPRRLGWRTIRLRLRGQLHYAAEPPTVGHEPHCEVRSVRKLRALLGIPSVAGLQPRGRPHSLDASGAE